MGGSRHICIGPAEAMKPEGSEDGESKIYIS